MRDNNEDLVLSGKWGDWKIRATGFYATCGCTVLGLVAGLIWLEPMVQAKHFLLICITLFVSGVTLGTGLMAGRLKDYSEELQRREVEISRMAKEKEKWEKKFLNNRSSSKSSKPISSKRKRSTK
jgi:hypothetical protein